MDDHILTRELFNILLKRKKTFIVVLLISLIISALFIYFITNQYAFLQYVNFPSSELRGPDGCIMEINKYLLLDYKNRNLNVKAQDKNLIRIRLVDRLKNKAKVSQIIQNSIDHIQNKYKERLSLLYENIDKQLNELSFERKKLTKEIALINNKIKWNTLEISNLVKRNEILTQNLDSSDSSKSKYYSFFNNEVKNIEISSSKIKIENDLLLISIIKIKKYLSNQNEKELKSLKSKRLSLKNISIRQPLKTDKIQSRYFIRSSILLLFSIIISFFSILVLDINDKR